MLVEWRNVGIKSYIYSSGSREAQRLFFEHSQAGDLRPFLCGFFDTTSGPKTEAASYTNIQHTLGVDDADQVGGGLCAGLSMQLQWLCATHALYPLPCNPCFVFRIGGLLC